MGCLRRILKAHPAGGGVMSDFNGIRAVQARTGNSSVAPDLCGRLRVLLLGRFGLARVDCAVLLAPASQRLLALVALNGRAISRGQAAGLLWPAVSEERANTSLRSALARLGARSAGVVCADALAVSLVAGVGVDLHDGQVIARRLLAGAGAVRPDAAAAAVAGLSVELLPGWYEDW